MKWRCAVSSVAGAHHVQFLIVQIVDAILTGIGSRRTRHGDSAAGPDADAQSTQPVMTDVMAVVVAAVVVVVAVMVSVQSAAAHADTSAARRVVVVMFVAGRIVVMPLRRRQHGLPAGQNLETKINKDFLLFYIQLDF